MDENIRDPFIELSENCQSLFEQIDGDNDLFYENAASLLLVPVIKSWMSNGDPLPLGVGYDIEEHERKKNLAIQALRGNDGVAFLMSCILYCMALIEDDEVMGPEAVRYLCFAYELYGVASHIAEFPQLGVDDVEKLKRKMASLILKEQAQRAVKKKLADDPKQREKSFIRECWLGWKNGASHYNSKAEFARDMIEKCEHLTSTKKIEDWCREWEKMTITQPAE